MSDTQETENVDAPAEESQEATEAANGEPTAPVKKVKASYACLCQSYEVADPADADSVFTTGCEQTTNSVFAQGHDARLVSFLVDGHFDGYQLRRATAQGIELYATPADAVAHVSDALRDKATKATANRQAKAEAKAKATAEREAKKAEAKAAKEKAAADKAAAKEASAAKGPKATGAEVVAGSSEGDQTPLGDGEVKIKVGRWEYNATIDEDGNATYVDGKGETQTVERDGYRVLEIAGV